MTDENRAPVRERVGTVAAVRRHLSWYHVAIVVGAAIAVPHLSRDPTSLRELVVRDALALVVAPAVVARWWFGSGEWRTALGWRVDRRALRDAIGLTLAVLPIYLVGSTLPAMRSAHPIWPIGDTLVDFLPFAVGMACVLLAMETYYRGFLAIGLRGLGRGRYFVALPPYLLLHLGLAPIEVVLSVPAHVVLAAVDARSDSILPSTAAHVTGFLVLSWLVTRPPIFDPGPIVQVLEWVFAVA